MSYVIVGVICAVLGFGGGVFFAVRFLADWIHAVEDAYVRAEGAVTSWIERAFLWIKGAL